MKRLFKVSVIILLVLMLIVGITACGDKSVTPSTTSSTQGATANNPEETSSPIVEDKTNFTDDMYAAKRNGKWGVINENGDVIIDFTYIDCHEDFSNGLWSVKNSSSWGAVNVKNETIISFEYEEIGVFSDNVCPVKKGGYWGVVNEKNKTVIEFQYDTATEKFVDRLLGVSINGAGGVISKDGNYIIPLNGEYGKVEQITKSHILMGYDVNYDVVWGSANATFVFDTSGKELYRAGASSDFMTHPVEGERISILDDEHFCIVGKNGCRIFDAKGNELFEVNKLLGLEHREYFGQMNFPFRLFGNGYYYVEYEKNNHWSISLFNLQGELFFDKQLEKYNEQKRGGANLFAFPDGSVWCYWNDNYYGGENDVCYFEHYNKNGVLISSGTEQTDEDTFVYSISPWNQNWLLKIYNHQTSTIYNPFNGNSADFGEIIEFLGQHGSTGGVGWDTKDFPANAIIVKDTNNIFYGLFVKDKLAIPCEYNKITYNASSDFFTLQKGNTSRKIRVARNGRIIEIN